VQSVSLTVRRHERASRLHRRLAYDSGSLDQILVVVRTIKMHSIIHDTRHLHRNERSGLLSLGTSLYFVLLVTFDSVSKRYMFSGRIER
jgi:hypothetical protein